MTSRELGPSCWARCDGLANGVRHLRHLHQRGAAIACGLDELSRGGGTRITRRRAQHHGFGKREENAGHFADRLVAHGAEHHHQRTGAGQAEMLR